MDSSDSRPVVPSEVLGARLRSFELLEFIGSVMANGLAEAESLVPNEVRCVFYLDGFS